jgi:alkylhydroperoxidase/carboxymuconolactone decarboxylase family protein YurZ
MEKKLTTFLAVLWVFLLSVAAISEAQKMDAHQTLSAQQQRIIPIAAFTANGDLDKLRTALHAGLDAGLTVNEIKEILVQMYAYAGFPRSLNGINTFMAVMDERQAKGIKDAMGKDASPVPADMNKDEYGAKVRARLGGRDVIPPPSGYQLFTPVIDTFLKEHLFADIFARDTLDFLSREIATVGALSSLEGVNPMLRFHMDAAMNVGLTEHQAKALVAVIGSEVGKKAGDNAGEVLHQVLDSRAK